MDFPDFLGFTAAVSGAASAGLLTALVDGPPRTIDELAATCKTNARATALVIDVLVAYGAAVRDGDKVTASPGLRMVAATPGGTARTLAMWGHVPAFLETGQPFLKMDEGREQAYSTVVSQLGKLFGEAAAALARQLDVTPKRILDVGCGSGVWGLAIGQRHRDARVTGLDLPAVLESFRARATELGIADRIDTLPGDVHQIAIPRAFDLVVIANVLRIESPERARQIVKRAVAALEPGGTLLVIDALATGTPERDQARSVYALHLGMRTEHGRVYSRDEIGAWISETGLSPDGKLEIDLETRAGALGAIVAR